MAPSLLTLPVKKSPSNETFIEFNSTLNVAPIYANPVLDQLLLKIKNEQTDETLIAKREKNFYKKNLFKNSSLARPSKISKLRAKN